MYKCIIKYEEITNTKLAKELNILLLVVSKIRSEESKKNEEMERIINSITNKGIIQA